MLCKSADCIRVRPDKVKERRKTHSQSASGVITPSQEYGGRVVLFAVPQKGKENGYVSSQYEAHQNIIS